MKKSVKFMAVVLAVVLALSCFTVAFAAKDKDETSIWDNIGTFFAGIFNKENVNKNIKEMKELPGKLFVKTWYDVNTEDQTLTFRLPDPKIDPVTVRPDDPATQDVDEKIEIKFDWFNKMFENNIYNGIIENITPKIKPIVEGFGNFFKLLPTPAPDAGSST